MHFETLFILMILTNIIVNVVQNKVEGTYSCVHPNNVRFSDIAKAAFSAFDKEAEIYFLKDKEDIPDNIFEKDDSLYKKIDFILKSLLKKA